MENEKQVYKVMWPDTLEIEEGEILDEMVNDFLFKSYIDHTINWIPKKYFLKD